MIRDRGGEAAAHHLSGTAVKEVAVAFKLSVPSIR
eukprot:SAG31_NODE_16476_length_707_cov_4.074013_1_plen_35_part_10